MACERTRPGIAVAAGMVVAVAVAGSAGTGRAEPPAPAAGGDLTALRATLDRQASQITEQQRRLAEQMRAVEEQQKRLEELRRQLAGGGVRTAAQADAGAAEPFAAAPRMSDEEAASLRGGQGNGASTLQTLPPQRFFGRVRGQVIPVTPESLEEVGPFEGEPPIPVFVPEDRRKEFLRLRRQMQELVVPSEQQPAPPPAQPPAETAVTRREPAPAPAPPPQPAPTPPTAVVPPERAAPQEAAPPTKPTQVATLEVERPEIVGEALAKVGGVLTPAGVLVVEPSVEYVNNSANRFNFAGVEVVGVLFGAIEARQTERNIVTTAATLRYGVTDRIEVDAKFPFVYRSDEDRTQVVGGVETGGTIDNAGLGDIEFGAHYQITGTSPFLIANLRAKSDTGTGPFDVDRDGTGVETESPTGSGFWSLEPSLSMIYPVEPAVFFANAGYLYNFAKDVDEQVGDTEFGRVDPGDAVKASLGLGFALNERTSVSLGYEHNYVFETDSRVTDANGTRHENSDTLQVGSFFVGGAYAFNDNVSINSTLELGATDDAPDVQFVMRVPVRFNVMNALHKIGVGGDNG